LGPLSDLELATASRLRTSSFVLRTSFIYSIFKSQLRPAGLVGQERFELSTPRLSSVCSNQLSYWPKLIGLSRPNSKSLDCGSHRWRVELTLVLLTMIDRNRRGTRPTTNSRKEVIQPQVPLRLPCYDFTPVTSHSLGGCLRGWRTDF
jgi:hypothetical protein